MRNVPRFRLRTPTLAIDERKHAVPLSAGSVVEVLVEPTPGSSMVQVRTEGRSVDIFVQDLNERGEQLTDAAD